MITITITETQAKCLQELIQDEFLFITTDNIKQFELLGIVADMLELKLETHHENNTN